MASSLKCIEMTAKEHSDATAEPISEAALTKALEERGIGRPSTYASIIDTIQNRNYAFKKGGALVPTWVAFSVVQLLEQHLASLVDYQFTAKMEDDLDAISRGEQEYVEYLTAFYFGNGMRRVSSRNWNTKANRSTPATSAAFGSARRKVVTRFTCALAATRRSSSKAIGPPRCPMKRRPMR